MLYVAWRKAMRQLFHIDYRTHNYIVFSLSGNIETRFHRKLAKFICTLLNSENLYVSDVVSHLLQFSSSTIAENYRYLSCMYNITPDDWINNIFCVLRKVKSPDILSDEHAINVSVVKELINMRDDLTSTN